MGNQQSISSTNQNEKNNDNILIKEHLKLSSSFEKEKTIYNLNDLKIFGNSSSVLGETSEASSMDIMMKETNESIKSLDENNFKGENLNYIINPKETNLKCSSNMNENLNNCKKTVVVKIVWNEGGENVFISGNFVNWSQWFFMTKKDNQHFEIIFVNFLIIFVC